MTMRALEFLLCGVIAAQLGSCADTPANGTRTDGATMDGTAGVATTTAGTTTVGASSGGSAAVATSGGGATAGDTSNGGEAAGGSTGIATSSGGTAAGGSMDIATSGGGTTPGGTSSGGATAVATSGGGATAAGADSGGSGTFGMAAGGVSSGGVSDGGTAGGGMGNGGAAGGGSAVGCSPELPLCDDFESYALGQVPDGRWQTVRTPSQGGSMVVDDTNSFSGTQALHITADFQGYSGVNLGTKSGDAAFGTADTYYVRFMLFQKALTNADELHARMMRIGTMNVPNGDDGTGYTFGLHSYPKPISLQLESLNDTFVSTRVDPPLDRWVCWEVEFGPGTIGWWQDDELIDTPEPSGWAQVAMSMLELGFEAYSPVTTELWYDDIAVDTERIGCPVAQ